MFLYNTFYIIISPRSITLRALLSTLFGTHLKDLENFLSFCSFLVNQVCNLVLYPRHETVPVSWFTAGSGTRNSNLCIIFEEKTGYKQIIFSHTKAPLKGSVLFQRFSCPSPRPWHQEKVLSGHSSIKMVSNIAQPWRTILDV